MVSGWVLSPLYVWAGQLLWHASASGYSRQAWLLLAISSPVFRFRLFFYQIYLLPKCMLGSSSIFSFVYALRQRSLAASKTYPFTTRIVLRNLPPEPYVLSIHHLSSSLLCPLAALLVWWPMTFLTSPATIPYLQWNKLEVLLSPVERTHLFTSTAFLPLRNPFFNSTTSWITART